MTKGTEMFRFDLHKTIHAAGVLLQCEPEHCMSRMRLLKLLYLADRLALKQTLHPITGDSACAMNNGPVLSQTYDLIKGEHAGADAWAEHFNNEGYKVKMVSSPGRDLLSKDEIRILKAVCDEHRERDDWDLSEYTHTLPEYSDPNGSSRPITFEQILQAVGKGDCISELRSELQSIHAAIDILDGGGSS